MNATTQKETLRARFRAVSAALETSKGMLAVLHGRANAKARLEWMWIFDKCRKEHTRLYNLLKREWCA